MVNLFLAKRFLRSKKESSFISFITLISIAGIAIGVAALIIAVSVLGGFEKEITEKIKKHITFLGSIPNFEIPSLIEKAQICCYPSHMEAMPLAWLEVLAMGKVFLGSTTGPGPEAVQDGITGFLVNPHDPKAIANKIKYIFENYDKAIKMGIEARKRVINEFDVREKKKKNIEFYTSILKNQ